MSNPLSVCIIACNEEANLPRCLASVAFADDCVVVIDDRSEDSSEAIARAHGARVFVRPYEGNVEQKGFALAQAHHDWVLAIDADESLPPDLQSEVHARMADEAPAESGFEMNRCTHHLGRWIRHGDFFPDWQPRLFRRSSARWVGTNPHGRVQIDGPVGRLRGELAHHSYRDLADQVARIQDSSRVQAAAMRARGRRARIRDLVVRPPFRFFRAYVLKQGFRDGTPGLVIAAASAFHVFLKYAKLWELERIGPAREEPAAGKAAGGMRTVRPPAS